jgi:hypothetical protein
MAPTFLASPLLILSLTILSVSAENVTLFAPGGGLEERRLAKIVLLENVELDNFPRPTPPKLRLR